MGCDDPRAVDEEVGRRCERSGVLRARHRVRPDVAGQVRTARRELGEDGTLHRPHVRDDSRGVPLESAQNGRRDGGGRYGNDHQPHLVRRCLVRGSGAEPRGDACVRGDPVTEVDAMASRDEHHADGGTHESRADDDDALAGLVTHAQPP